MNLFAWDSYPPEEINDKIKYWVDLWEDLIENFNNKLYGLDLLNPHVVIGEVIDEINWNHFKNEENRSYF